MVTYGNAAPAAGTGMRLFADESVNALGDGVVHFAAALDLPLQRQLATTCLALMNGPVPAYVPQVRGGGQMHVRMLCLGRHWNGRLYRYEATRSDFDGQAVPVIPAAWVDLAATYAARAGFSMTPDVCIINHYGAVGRMGLHQDKDESAASVAAGAPIVSFSLGDGARFLLGGTRRRDPVVPMALESGDVLVFGGPARLRYHGVARIHRGTGPAGLDLEGRLNLTFRQY